LDGIVASKAKKQKPAALRFSDEDDEDENLVEGNAL
jgi:hypothetical protein